MPRPIRGGGIINKSIKPVEVMIIGNIEHTGKLDILNLRDCGFIMQAEMTDEKIINTQ